MELYVVRYLALLFLLFPYAVAANDDCPLYGYWKSNEQMTLDSFDKSKDKTQKQEEIFGSGFFGELVIFIECHQFTSALEGWSETIQYELVSANEREVAIKYIESPYDKESSIKKADLSENGACYSIPINGGQFLEYFCKSNANAYRKALQAIDNVPTKF